MMDRTAWQCSAYEDFLSALKTGPQHNSEESPFRERITIDLSDANKPGFHDNQEFDPLFSNVKQDSDVCYDDHVFSPTHSPTYPYTTDSGSVEDDYDISTNIHFPYSEEITSFSSNPDLLNDENILIIRQNEQEISEDEPLIVIDCEEKENTNNIDNSSNTSLTVTIPENDEEHPTRVPSPFEIITQEAIRSSSSPNGTVTTGEQKREKNVHADDNLSESTSQPSPKRSNSQASLHQSKRHSTASVTSDRSSRIDPHTYHTYASGLLYSSGKCEKFLKLQKNFAVLNRINELGAQNEKKDHSTSKSHSNLYDGGKGLSIRDNIEEVSELHNELDEAQKKKEFFFINKDNMSNCSWQPEKDRGLRSSVSLQERMKQYTNATKDDSIKDKVRSKKKDVESVKRVISFGELHSKYNTPNVNSTIDVEPLSRLTAAFSPQTESQPGDFGQKYPQTYLDRQNLASKQAKQRPIYGTNINNKEHVYEKYIKQTKSARDLKRNFDNPTANIKPFSSAPNLSFSSESPQLGRKHRQNRNDNTDDKPDNTQNACHTSLETVCSSLETLPSYEDSLKRQIGNHFSKSEPDISEVYPKVNKPSVSFNIPTHSESVHLGSDSTSTDNTVIEVTNPYEINVQGRNRVPSTGSEDSSVLHIRSTSAPLQAKPIIVAPTSSGTLQRCNSSKDTFFAMNTDSTAPKSQDGPNTPPLSIFKSTNVDSEPLVSSKCDTETCSQQLSMNHEDDFSQFNSSRPVPCFLLCHAERKARIAQAIKGTNNCQDSVQSEKQVDDSKVPNVTDTSHMRSKDIFAKHLDSAQPTKYSHGEVHSTRSSSTSSRDSTSSRVTAQPIVENARYSERDINIPRSRLLSHHTDHSDNESVVDEKASNNSRYEDLLVKARRERMARKGYIHSYVNDPDSVDFEPYSSMTDSDFRFLNAYPGEQQSVLRSNHYCEDLNRPFSLDESTSEYQFDPFSPVTANNSSPIFDSEAKPRTPPYQIERVSERAHSSQPHSRLSLDFYANEGSSHDCIIDSVDKIPKPYRYSAQFKEKKEIEEEQNMPDVVQIEIQDKRSNTADNFYEIEKESSKRLPSSKTNANFKVVNLRGFAKDNDFSNQKPSWMQRSAVKQSPTVEPVVLRRATPVLRSNNKDSLSSINSFDSNLINNIIPSSEIKRLVPTPAPRKNSTGSTDKISVPSSLVNTHANPRPLPDSSNSRSNLGSNTALMKKPLNIDMKADHSNLEYGQLRKWDGVIDINQDQDPDSSFSPNSSVGSTGTFIINNSEDEKGWGFDKSPQSPLREVVRKVNSDGINLKSDNDFKYQKSRHTNNKVDTDSRLTNNSTVLPIPPPKSKSSVSTLKNMFEASPLPPQTSSMVRTKSVPDLVQRDESYTAVSNPSIQSRTRSLPRSTSNRTNQLRSQFELQSQMENDINKSRHVPLNLKDKNRFHKQHIEYGNADYDNRNIKLESKSSNLTAAPSVTEPTNYSGGYDPYIPPDDICKEVESVREGRKLDVPRKKHHSPSHLGKLTLEYFDQIGSEWGSFTNGPPRRRGDSNIVPSNLNLTFDNEPGNARNDDMHSSSSISRPSRPVFRNSDDNDERMNKSIENGDSNVMGEGDNYMNSQTDDMKLSHGRKMINGVARSKLIMITDSDSQQTLPQIQTPSSKGYNTYNVNYKSDHVEHDATSGNRPGKYLHVQDAKNHVVESARSPSGKKITSPNRDKNRLLDEIRSRTGNTNTSNNTRHFPSYPQSDWSPKVPPLPIEREKIPGKSTLVNNWVQGQGK